ncbi:homogentisate 1,2-dioxygenase [Novosphingobium sp. JCM 18896]|uniref:homogentisate 1,2-dioxygenase n=1 Tax=Novosphingobium sp. JCM 18896 TaxID=2989731 RepID=UPI00222193FF|nr:homogentisate 1,2-dioxygenase [Novosphingobium sp. JCM 18896]MCW1429902.1 homogentisate 1,2-dioxygenase [Novosphingobium sp. JCM 18896]
MKAVAIVSPLMLSVAVQAQDHMHDHAPAEPARTAELECRAQTPPTGELAPWTSPIPFEAGSVVDTAPGLAVGQAANVTLKPTPEVRYALRPEKPGGSVSFGGLIALNVAEAGTFRVALSSGAWIDLVQDGKAVTSTSHGHGPACSGVRKMVDFPLKPGRYTLQLGANGAPQMTVLVARLP